MMTRRAFVALGAISAGFLLPPACKADLGSWTVCDISDRGVMVGFQTNASGTSRAVLRSSQGELRLLPSFPGDTGSQAVSIGGDGTIAGNSWSSASSHVVLWNGSFAIRDLGRLSGLDTRAFAVNDASVVVGAAYGYLFTKAWVYEPAAGHIAALPVPANTLHAEATAVNDRGEIAGTISGGTPAQVRAVKWAPGTRALSVLPLPPNVSDVRVSGINASGAVVGTVDRRPVLWTSSSAEPVYLPLGGRSAGKANDIDDAGIIVGKVVSDAVPSAAYAVEAGKAALWTVDRRLVDLDPDAEPGTTVASEAKAINAAGAVVGNVVSIRNDPQGRATQFR